MRAALLCARDGLPTGEGWEQDHALALEGHDTAARLASLAEGAEVIVSAGPYAPGRFAAAVVGERPWFADVPGDPFAELQAVAIAGAEGELGARAQATDLAARSVLARADAFSVVSEPQRAGLIGQLGLMGRLADPDPAERIFTVPVAWRFPQAPRPPRPRAPGDPLVVALAGGFNTWLDEDTLMDGLGRALRAEPRISALALGGPIPGHHTRGYARFEAWARAWPDRVRLHPWAPERELEALLGAAHVGLCLDRPGYEAELGSRTRLLFFAHQGLLGVGTARAALARELVALGGLRPVPVGDGAALAETLCSLVHEPAPVAQIQAAAASLAARYDPARVLAPLLTWLEAPRRRAPAPEHAALARIAVLEAELRAVQQSPTWRALARGHRLIRRLKP